MNSKALFEAIGSAKSVKLGLAANPESSSSWVKTLVDPAHAREYGCRGIPDENQQPSLVLCGRDTATFTPYSQPGTNDKWYYYSDGTGWTSVGVADLRIETITDVYVVMNCINVPYLTVYLGRGTYRDSLSWVVWLTRGDTLVSTNNAMSRLVAQSATISWVGKEIDRAGFFESGYLLPQVTDSNVAENKLSVLLDLDQVPNLTTFTSDAADGVYSIATFNDYDTYRYWKGTRTFQNQLRLLGSPIYLDKYQEYVSPQGFGGMRPYFIHYSVFTSGKSDEVNSTWAFRLTTNQVVERMAHYAEGGSDAAVYDRNSVEDMIVLYDSFDLIFPASYNDFKKVWQFVKRNAPKTLSLVAQVMKHFPSTSSVGQALDTLAGLVNDKAYDEYTKALKVFGAATRADNGSKKSKKNKALKKLTRSLPLPN